MEWDKLWTINKKIIDPVCPRHDAVSAERVLLMLSDGPDDPFVRIIPRHKKYPGSGNKATTYTKSIWINLADAKSISPEEEITLMDWGNAIVKEISKDEDESIKHLTGVLNLGGSVKTTKLKLTCLPHFHDDAVKMLMFCGHLAGASKSLGLLQLTWLAVLRFISFCMLPSSDEDQPHEELSWLLPEHKEGRKA